MERQEAKDAIERKSWAQLLERDQLIREKCENRVFSHGVAKILKSENSVFSVMDMALTVQKRTFNFYQNFTKTPSGDFKQVSEEF